MPLNAQVIMFILKTWRKVIMCVNVASTRCEQLFTNVGQNKICGSIIWKYFTDEKKDGEIFESFKREDFKIINNVQK